MKWWEMCLVTFFCVVCAFALFVMFGVLPVSMYADAKCLRNGYPRSHVTIGLEMYCSTLDGSTTVKVEKIR